MSKRILAAALIFLAAAAPAIAAEPYEGRWAEDPAWCGNSRAAGSDRMPMTITRKSVETFASRCVVMSVRRVGALWRLQTNCRDEGHDLTEPPVPNTFILRVDGDQLFLRDDRGIQNLIRCPR